VSVRLASFLRYSSSAGWTVAAVIYYTSSYLNIQKVRVNRIFVFASRYVVGEGGRV